MLFRWMLICIQICKVILAAEFSVHSNAALDLPNFGLQACTVKKRNGGNPSNDPSQHKIIASK